MKIDKVEGKDISFPQIRGSLSGVKFPAFAEIKYDGEFNYICYENDDIFTINKYGKIRRDFPRLRILEKRLRANDVKEAIFLCEIFWGLGQLGSLYDLLKYKEDDRVRFKIFDIIELNHCSLRKQPLIARKEVIQAVGAGRWLAKCFVIDDSDEAEQVFKEFVDKGYEGIVVKSLESKFQQGPCDWVKMKFKDQSEYHVIAIDPTQERIEVVVMSMGELNQIRYIHVGVKAPNKYKKHIKLMDSVTIEHQGILPSGSLRHPVLVPKKEWK